MHTTYRTLRRASKDLFPQGGWKRPRVLARLWVQGLINFRLISEACNYSGPGSLAQNRANESEFWGTLVWPLIDARWDTERRIQEFMSHYRVAAKLGDLLELQMDEVRPLLKLDTICDSLEVCLERRTWFSREGQCTLSLFYAGQRMYSLAFLLSNKEGRRVAYVGAIQGAKQAEDSDAYKTLTKAAHGLRPRDLVIALFQVLCEAMLVNQILAVQDRNRQHQHHYYGFGGNPKVFADYDSIWIENGGVLQTDGMYVLAPGVRQKDLTEVASKKRSMYRKRETFLEECQQIFHGMVQASINAQYETGLAAQALRPQSRKILPPDNIIRNWLNKMRPAFVGSWLWSFPAIFM